MTQGVRYTKEEFIVRARSIHGDKYDYSNVIYMSAREKVEIICPIHGPFPQTPDKHVNRPAGCKKCGTASAAKLQAKSQKDYLAEVKEVHGDTYIYDDVVYVSNDTLIQITCRVHGNFPQSPIVHLHGHGCPHCTKRVSKGETRWLDWLGITTRQFLVKLPNGKRARRVDGYDAMTNNIYEFYGDFWHGNPKIYDPMVKNCFNKKTMGALYQKTLDDEIMYKKYGYNLVVIWESDWNIIWEQIKERMSPPPL